MKGFILINSVEGNTTDEELQEREAIQNEQNYNYDFGDDLPF